MTPPAPIRPTSDATGAVPMGPLSIMSTGARERAREAAIAPLPPRTTLFVPPTSTLAGVVGGTGSRAPSHSSRAAGRGEGSRTEPGLSLGYSMHRGRGLEPEFVSSSGTGGTTSLPVGSTTRRPRTAEARFEALIASARDHYNTGMVDSRLGTSGADRATGEFAAAERDLRAARRLLREHPSLSRRVGGETIREIGDLSHRVESASLDLALSRDINL